MVRVRALACASLAILLFGAARCSAPPRATYQTQIGVGDTAEVPATLGPFQPSPALALYFLGDGRPAKARITVRRVKPALSERAMVRAFDPDERLTFWRYVEALASEAGAPASAPLLDEEVAIEGEGVSQVRIVAGAENSLVTVVSSRKLGWGVSFQNGSFRPWVGQPATLYAFVPPHAVEMHVSGGPVSISDGPVTVHASTSESAPFSVVPIARTETPWRVDFPRTERWSLRVAGLPFILSPSEEVARRIKGSVETLGDGTALCHRFQRRIADLLPKLLAPESVGRAEDLTVPLANRRGSIRDPARDALALGDYGFLSRIDWDLRNQNLDASDHWGGAIDGWQRRRGLASPANRWDTFLGVEGMWGASAAFSSAAETLAWGALVEAPLNRYRGKTALLYRAAASALRDLMVVGQDETLPGSGAELDNYPGRMAFVLAEKVVPVYELAAPHMPPVVYDTWTEAVRHLVDRSYPDPLVSTRNQSAHYLLAYEAFARGSGDIRYAVLARSYARRFIEGLAPAGYAPEAEGPDASYSGISHYYMAIYERQSGDAMMLDAIRRSYRFWNRTVAPEPDGVLLGTSSFSHRTASGFDREQYGGARNLVDDRVPEVARWRKAPTERETEEARRALEHWVDEPPPPLEPSRVSRNLLTRKFVYYVNQPSKAPWPAADPAPAFEELGGEVVAVRRPAYYALVFVGRPAPDPWYIRDRERFRLPLDGNAESAGGLVDIHGAKGVGTVTPYVGGGLSLFWTPHYGTSVSGMNWAPSTHHGVVATDVAGRRSWEDYFATTHEAHPDRWELDVRGRLEGHPLSYVRRYDFQPGGVRVHLVVRAERACSLQSLVENIPIALGPIKSRGATIAADGERDGRALTGGWTVVARDGDGVAFRLDHARQLHIVRSGLQDEKLQVGRVEVALPHKLRGGEEVVLDYEISPLAVRERASKPREAGDLSRR
jgi:hypothetical protein